MADKTPTAGMKQPGQVASAVRWISPARCGKPRSRLHGFSLCHGLALRVRRDREKILSFSPGRLPFPDSLEQPGLKIAAHLVCRINKLRRSSFLPALSASKP